MIAQLPSPARSELRERLPRILHARRPGDYLGEWGTHDLDLLGARQHLVGFRPFRVRRILQGLTIPAAGREYCCVNYCAGRQGSVTRISAPRPAQLPTWICPSCASTMRRAIAMPNPVPLVLVV